VNILTDALPETIDISGEIYKINSDFRTCLKIIMAFEDETLTGYEKQIILLSNLYQTVPANTQYAISQANLFLNGGKSDSDEGGDGSPRLYSFIKDANFIFAAFRQTHGIDLQKADLHWWEFLALFMDLGGETTFSNLIGLRKRVKNGTATKEERQAAHDMGEAFEIPEPDTRTFDEKEKEREFMRLVSQG
jgi:hypothetical protein